MRPGRLDRKIEIPLPNEVARMEILKIHCNPVQKHGEIGTPSPSTRAVVRSHRSLTCEGMGFAGLDYEAIVKLTEGANGSDLRNVATEGGMFAIRDDRDYVTQDDLVKAARKTMEVSPSPSRRLPRTR